MPILGFGTLYLTDELGVRSVSEAISLGYRLIDTATVYANEEAVGGGIKKSGIDRKDLFVTSKVWVDDSGYEKANSALNSYGIQMEAWSPLAQGRNGHFTNETLAAIGRKHDKTNAQVSLRWHYQRGIVSIPRSSQRAQMMENLNIFDFELDEMDMSAISSLDLDVTQFPEWE